MYTPQHEQPVLRDLCVGISSQMCGVGQWWWECWRCGDDAQVTSKCRKKKVS